MSIGRIESSTAECHTDSNLMEAIRSGDRVALERLYLRYHSRLRRFLTMCSAGRHKIEDLINETFLTVWEQAKDFRPKCKVSTWVAGIACGLVTPPLNSDSPISVDAAAESAPGNWLIAALIQLPMEQRITLSLAYQLGLSIEEIGEVTRCTLETAQSRMSLARMQIGEAAARVNRRPLNSPERPRQVAWEP
jgi:RNA polymerase sigma-70 factor, ECF subfamily